MTCKEKPKYKLLSILSPVPDQILIGLKTFFWTQYFDDYPDLFPNDILLKVISIAIASNFFKNVTSHFGCDVERTFQTIFRPT